MWVYDHALNRFLKKYLLIMQTEINNDVHLAQAVTSRKQSDGGIKSIDISTDFDEIMKKIGKIDTLLKSSMMDNV